MRTIADLVLAVPDYAAPIWACVVRTGTGGAGIERFDVGVGTSRKLLSVYEGVHYRGDFSIVSLAHGVHAPTDVYRALCALLQDMAQRAWKEVA